MTGNQLPPERGCDLILKPIRAEASQIADSESLKHRRKERKSVERFGKSIRSSKIGGMRKVRSAHKKRGAELSNVA